jgi:hypothetical protein
MKIKNYEENLKKIFELLKKLELSSLNENSLFFPIENEGKIEESESGVILTEIKSDGFQKFITPGFIIDSYNEVPLLAYISSEYSLKINILEHVKMFKSKFLKLTDKEKEMLSDIDCMIVKSPQVLLKFKF